LAGSGVFLATAAGGGVEEDAKRPIDIVGLDRGDEIPRRELDDAREEEKFERSESFFFGAPADDDSSVVGVTLR